MSIHLSIQNILYKFMPSKNNALHIKYESGLRTIRTSRDVNGRLFCI